MPKSSQQSAMALLTGLIERVARLEVRLVAVEKQVATSDDDGLQDFFKKQCGYRGDDDNDAAKPELVPVKRGRRPRIPREELEQRRDDLVQFIEIRWPDLVDYLKRRRSKESLLQAIKNASPGAESNWPYRHMTEHIGALCEFLQSGRYKGEPRQIAYAMAGVPELTWRSSLDYCTKNPSRLHIALPAFMDHIRRHNDLCLKSLLQDGATPENLRRLRRCCAECRHLAEKPERVVEALQEGKALM